MSECGAGTPARVPGDRSFVTVLLAGAANLVIAVAKLVGGLVTGSSAMLSEAAHSFADMLNQAFLMAALRRSSKPADADHPFGYGMERYFWSLLAAVAIFVLGAGFSVLQGVDALVHPRRQESLLVAFVILAVALIFDGISLVRALWQVRREAAEQGDSLWRTLMHVSEPTVRAVVFEDTAAVFGVLLAGGGLLLDRALGSALFDAVASVLIGLLLIGVAYTLGRQNRDLLIGRAVDEAVLAGIREEVESSDGIERVLELLTMRLGPSEVLMAARVVVAEAMPGRELADLASDIDARVQSRFPEVRHVFLDPTPA